MTLEANERKLDLKRESELVSKLNRVMDESKKKYESMRRQKEATKASIHPLQEEFERNTKKLHDIKIQIKKQQKLSVELREDVDIFIASYLNEEDKEEEVKKILQKCKDTIKKKRNPG